MTTRSNNLNAIDKKNVWHPFTQMQEWLREKPVIIERGQGNYLFDTEGKKYLDGVSSLWVNVHGHRKREIDRAIKAQLGKIAHSTFLGLSNVPAVLLASELVKIAPAGLEKVFYSDNGSTSVEIALKMAFQFWQQKGAGFKRKKKFLTIRNAYHGDTIGSVSVGGIDMFHEIYKPLLFNSFKAPSPYCYRCELKLKPETCGLACAKAFERIVEEHSRELAAVVVEPGVQAAAGMIVHPRGYMRRIARAAKVNGVLLIVDEVATGFGRTGRMFSCEHQGIRPDFLCTAKGLTGGYLPLAATLTTKRVFDGFKGEFGSKRTFFHGHTYTANQLACAAALANLEIFRKERVLAGLRPKIRLIEKLLVPLRELDHVGDIRQFGMMVGIELVKNKSTKEEYRYGDKMGYKVAHAAREYEVLIRPLGDVIVLMPPLSITPRGLTALVDAVRKSIRQVTE